MHVSIEATGPLERRMTVRVPEEGIQREVSQRLIGLSRDTKIDGFRRGKAPMKVVERRFGRQMRREVIGEIVRSSFYEAIANENLRLAGNPAIEPLGASSGDGFSYQATFEVYPEIALAPVESLELVRPVCEITDADVDRMIETLRRQARRWQPVDRAADRGDQIDIDFQGTVEDRPFDGCEAKAFKFELGAGGLLAGFEDPLVGTRLGDELTIDLIFPPDHGDQNLAGKPVRFKVKVNGVSEAVMPDADDERFRRFGGTDEGLERFRKQIRQTLVRQRDETVASMVKRSVMAALLDANALDTPRVLIDNQAQRLHADMRHKLVTRGVPPEQIEALQPGMFADEARRQVGVRLIMAEIIKTAGLKAPPAKVRTVVEGIASGYDEPDRVIQWYYQDRKRLAGIESLVLENEVVDWVLDRAKLEQRPTTFDALMNPRHTEDTTREDA